MARVKKMVFISYRRKDQYSALLVYQYLTQRNYDVFLDYTKIPSGDFEQIIIANIRARPHFIVILTPTALDRCNEPGDWLRREIETAIAEKRNIIPLFFDGFRFNDPAVSKNLTGALATLQNYNGLDIPTGYFDEAMERLCSNRFLKVALDTVLHPVTEEAQKVVIKEQIAANNAIAQSQDHEFNAAPIAKEQNIPLDAPGEPPEKESIQFENGWTAEILRVRQAINPERILKNLDIAIPAAQAAIIVAGSTTPFPVRLKNRLTDLLGRGVAQAALEAGAIILDEGTNSGVSEIIGQGVADRGRLTKLIGVTSRGRASSPEGFVTEVDQNLDANHTHFVLNEQEMPSGQAQMVCRLARATASNKDWILTILVGGESEGAALDLALETVRRRWPLLVVEGSGSLADEIVRLKKAKTEKRVGHVWNGFFSFRNFRSPMLLRDTNSRLYEVISDGNITVVRNNFDAVQLRNLIKAIFVPKDEILRTAWQRFAAYDLNSARRRNEWRRLKNLPPYLGVMSILFVLIYSTSDLNSAGLIAGDQSSLWATGYTGFMRSLGNTIRAYPLLDQLFRFIIPALPISSLIFLGLETRLKLGSKYLVLRSAAEAVKRGIYSYRALGNRHANTSGIILPNSSQGLATHLERINKILRESDVNETALMPYQGPIPPNMFGAEAYDDGFSPLDPETYVKIRIDDQLKFYTLRTNQYERRIFQLQFLIWILSGIGVFLTMIGAQYWLPFTVALILAANAYLEYQQLEQILTRYNLTRSSLENVRANWLALPESERSKSKNVQNLVQDVEGILEREN